MKSNIQRLLSFFPFLIIFSSFAPAFLSQEESVPPVNWRTCQSQEMTNYFQSIVRNFSHIVRLDSIGKSIEGKIIWVLVISDSPTTRPLLKPQVKFVGNVNGFSGPSCYVLLRLINHLLQGYERENSLERKLIQTNEIHILPNMNPDGFRKSASGDCDGGQGRYNAAGVDLNRDFPDIFNPIPLEVHERQPETKAIMGWMAINNFVLSVSYITGAVVVSYPFDSIPLSDTENGPHMPPDEDIFKHLATTYVKTVNNVLNQSSQEQSSIYWHCPSLERVFPDGIVNGAEWMPVSGTMLDYNYVEGTFELLAGISCCRNENNEESLDKIWLNNKMAMLNMIHETDFGVRGQVVDSDSWAPLVEAHIVKLHQNFRLDEGVIRMPWRVSSKGEFWRLLLPGKYLAEVQVPGYIGQTIPFEVYPTHFTRLFIQLEKEKPITTPTPTKESSTRSTLRSSFVEEKDLMGDQSQSQFGELFNEIQNGVSLQETDQTNSNVSNGNSKIVTKSFIFKLLGKGVKLTGDILLVLIMIVITLSVNINNHAVSSSG